MWATRWYLLLFLLLNFSLSQVNLYTGKYVDGVPSVPSPDLILDNIPTLPLDFLFIYFFLFISHFLFIYPLIFEPKRYYYYLWLLSVLYITRTLFIVLIHLQVDPRCALHVFPSYFAPLTFTNDLFFSGHTAFPFLGFLMFRNRWAKIFFFIASLILGATVLLTHCHYSIDVFAAFFIAYGVYVGGTKIFEKLGWMPEQLKK